MNIWAILVATIAVFIASSIYYIIFAKQRAKVSAAAGKPSPWQALAELLRNVLLACVLAYLISLNDSGNAIVLALVLWVGFPMILLSGSVMYEKAPVKLAAIHAGDWLLKLLIMTTILSAWK